MPALTVAGVSHEVRSWDDQAESQNHQSIPEKLDWRVGLQNVFDAEGQLIKDYRVVTRMDRMTHLGIVGSKYVPFQNEEVHDFSRELAGEGVTYETSGSLSGGRRIWLLARIPGDVWVTKEDNVGKYLLLTTRHDGKSSFRVLFTPIRVVCANTLQAAIRGAGENGISIRHVGDIQNKLEEARRVLGLSLKYYDGWAEEATAFSKRSLTRTLVKEYFKTLVPDPKKGNPARARSQRKSLIRLFEVGKGNTLPTVRGSLWGAVNAVAEFVDHERTVRLATDSRPKDVIGQRGRNRTARFESSMFGTGATFKANAWKEALALL